MRPNKADSYKLQIRLIPRREIHIALMRVPYLPSVR